MVFKRENSICMKNNFRHYKRLHIIENSVIWHEKFSTPIIYTHITSKTKVMIWDKYQESIKREEKKIKEYKSSSIFVLAHS